eukprot:GEMP01058153.1.p1 GENE.GEMP01058153.1~~GEMP01058153.1.p1  ORF type:complete len:299 (+),score=81.38 GEMP01058153.1:40-936(+)
MWCIPAFFAFAVAQTAREVHSVLRELADAEKFLQGQEGAKEHLEESIVALREQVNGFQQKEEKLRQEQFLSRSNLEKEEGKFRKLQNASLKLASEYKQLLANRDKLKDENKLLRGAKATYMSAFKRIKSEMAPFVESAVESLSEASIVAAKPVIPEHVSPPARTDTSLGTKPNLADSALDTASATETSAVVANPEGADRAANVKPPTIVDIVPPKVAPAAISAWLDSTAKEATTPRKDQLVMAPMATDDFALTADASALAAAADTPGTDFSAETRNADSDADDQVMSLVQEAGFLKAA